VSAPGRSQVQITARGRETLAESPARITVAYLKRFPEFLDFHTVKTPESSIVPASHADEEETPQESLERLHKQLRDELAIELLDRVKQAPPSFF